MSSNFDEYQAETLNKVKEYMEHTRFIILGTVSENGKPALRTMASFANEQLDVYFSTGKQSTKVGHIKANPFVTILFQNEGQELTAFKNVTYTGKAELVDGDNGLEKAVKLLGDKNPWFKAMAEKGGLQGIDIFRVKPESIQYLDYSKGIGAAAITDVKI